MLSGSRYHVRIFLSLKILVREILGRQVTRVNLGIFTVLEVQNVNSDWMRDEWYIDS